ncbi:unnamed protein product [Linum tenue]|uniref:Prohibitin n=1 Tax=Linum tenue TaxID=586396 RepID=A0AAV0KQ97_9ROSI|nr:unnamed protein product [Linum tenue]
MRQSQTETGQPPPSPPSSFHYHRREISQSPRKPVFPMHTGTSLSRLTSSARKFLLPLVAAGTVTTAAATFHASRFTVPPGHRAVILDRLHGVSGTSIGEGTHYTVPWIRKPYIFDVRDKPHTFSCLAHTKDLQPVNLSLAISLRPDEVQTIVANYDVDQLLLKENNSGVLDDIHGSLVERAKRFNVLVVDVSILDLSCGEQVAQAVEQKQVARVEAETSKNLVVKAEHDKEAAVKRAEEELEAAKQFAELPEDVHEQLLAQSRAEAQREVDKVVAMFEDAANSSRSSVVDASNPSS